MTTSRGPGLRSNARIVRFQLALPITGAGLIVVGLVGLATVLPIQFVVVLLVVGLTIATLPVSMWLDVAVYTAMFSGLFRRLLAGDSGRIDADPFIIIPLFLATATIFAALFRKNVSTKIDWLSGLSVILAAVILASVAINVAFDYVALYFALTQVVPLLLLAAILAGLVPDIVPRLRRVYPLMALVAGGYGIYQFFFLPSWDRAWMQVADMVSIGRPFPMELRVFGVADSPGAFAAYLSVGILWMIQNAIVGSGVFRLGWIVGAMSLFGPLILTGVRTSLFGVVLVLLVLAVRGSRGSARLTMLTLIALLSVSVVAAVGMFGQTSSILTANRMTNLDLRNDVSFQARLELLRSAGSAFTRPFGVSDGQRLDNYFVDLLVAFGPIAGGIALLLMVVIGLRAWLNLADLAANGRAAHLCLFFLFTLIGGNMFVSSIAVLIALIFASGASARPSVTATFSSLSDPSSCLPAIGSHSSGTRLLLRHDRSVRRASALT